MAITRITDSTVIAPGAIVCFDAKIGCSGPVSITKASAGRLHFEQEGKPRYAARQRAKYLCDSIDEGERLFNFFYQRANAIDAAERQAAAAARKQVVDQFEPQFKALLGA